MSQREVAICNTGLNWKHGDIDSMRDSGCSMWFRVTGPALTGGAQAGQVRDVRSSDVFCVSGASDERGRCLTAFLAVRFCAPKAGGRIGNDA